VDWMRMLRTVVASLPKGFVCIDALDECLPKPSARSSVTKRYLSRVPLEEDIPDWEALCQGCYSNILCWGSRSLLGGHWQWLGMVIRGQ